MKDENWGEKLIKKRITMTETPVKGNLVERGIAKKNWRGKLVLTQTGKQLLLEKIGLEKGRKKEYSKKIRQLRTGKDKSQLVWGDYPGVFAIIKKFIPRLKGKKILEIGFGESDLIKVLEKEGAIITGIDTHKLYAFKGQVTADAYHLPYKPESFDLIYSCAVFGEEQPEQNTKSERLKDKPKQEKAIEEIHRALKLNGIAIMQIIYSAPSPTKNVWEKKGFRVMEIEDKETHSHTQYDYISGEQQRVRVDTHYLIAKKIR